MDFIIQKLVTLSSSREGELRDIAGLGELGDFDKPADVLTF